MAAPHPKAGRSHSWPEARRAFLTYINWLLMNGLEFVDYSREGREDKFKGCLDVKSRKAQKSLGSFYQRPQ